MNPILPDNATQTDNELLKELLDAISSSDLNQATFLLEQKGCLDVYSSEVAEKLMSQAISSHKSENGIAVICMLIQTGMSTIIHKRDCLNNDTLDKGLQKSLKAYRTNLTKQMQGLSSQQKVSGSKLRCLLYTDFKLRSWQKHLTHLHSTLKNALSAVFIQQSLCEEDQRLLTLKLQFQLIEHLRNGLKYYNPYSQQCSGIPTAFQEIAGVSDYAQYVDALYHTLLDSQYEAFEKFLNPLKEYSDDFVQLVSFEELLKVYTIEDTTQSFIDYWHDMLAQYINTTLPLSLRNMKQFSSRDVRKISINIGLYDILLSCWMHNALPQNQLPSSSTENNIYPFPPISDLQTPAMDNRNSRIW